VGLVSIAIKITEKKKSEVREGGDRGRVKRYQAQMEGAERKKARIERNFRAAFERMQARER
jgi:hypothetical protein